MQNPNALISMAYVSENANNPFAVFCEFIKYCIFANSSDYMRIAEIRDAVSQEFGIFLPHNVTLNCLSILKNEGIVKDERHQIKRVGTFDIESFEKDRLAFREKETALINELIKYISKFDLTWSEDYARKQLIKVLDGDGLAYEVFFRKKEEVSVETTKAEELLENDIIDIDAQNSDADDEVLFSDSFYVAKFIEELLESNNILTEYMKKVCEGLMISVGAYQLPSSDTHPIIPQIKGTVFYFDTKLLLRYIGCANEVAVKATQELVNLIQSGGGIVAYFPHTLTEMEDALSDASNCLKYRHPIKDYEMSIYVSSINYNRAIIAAKKASLVQELEKANIVLRQLQNYSDSDRLRFGFDRNDLLIYMQSKLDWEPRTIENDALSIWETHMCRGGNYRDYCGTTGRLCVFVTSNAKLIEIALGYRKERPNINTISNWGVNRLPVITDVRLTCRLWNPSTQVERLSLLHLTANVVAAQHPTTLYINKIKTLANELSNSVPEYSNICLTEYFDDEVTNKLFEKTNGKEENLNISTFAGTITEISEMKAKAQEEVTKQEEAAKIEFKTQLEEQTNDIIIGAVQKYKNKLGVLKVYLLLLLHWKEIVTIFFVGISAAISSAIGNWHFLLLIAIPIMVAIVEQFVTSNYLLKKALRKVLPLIEKAFEKKVRKQMSVAELKHKEKIMQETKDQTDILKKCEDLLKQ